MIVNDPAVGSGRRMSERGAGAPLAGDRLLDAARPAAGDEARQRGAATRRRAPATPAGASRRRRALEDGSYEALVARAVALARAAERRRRRRRCWNAPSPLEPERPEAWVERGGLRFLDGPLRRGDRRPAPRARDPGRRVRARPARLLAAARRPRAGGARRLERPRQADARPVEISGLRGHAGRGRAPGDRPRGGRARDARGAAGGAPPARGDRRLRADHAAPEARVATAMPISRSRSPSATVSRTAPSTSWSRPASGSPGSGCGCATRTWAARGVSLGGAWRWQENRPEASLQMSWPRPLGLPVVPRVSGFRGEQAYELGGPFAIRQRGFDLGVRHVLGAGSVLSAGLRLRERDVSTRRRTRRPGASSGSRRGWRRGSSRRGATGSTPTCALSSAPPGVRVRACVPAGRGGAALRGRRLEAGGPQRRALGVRRAPARRLGEWRAPGGRDVRARRELRVRYAAARAPVDAARRHRRQSGRTLVRAAERRVAAAAAAPVRLRCRGRRLR